MSYIASKSGKKSYLVSHTDGVDYIELIKPTSRLGVLLNPDHVDNIDLNFGTILSVRRLMEFLGKNDYPPSFLRKNRLSKNNIMQIRELTNKHCDGYWAIVLYYMIIKVRTHKELQSLLASNDLGFAATHGVATDKLLNKSLDVKNNIQQLSFYIGCIRIVSELVKNKQINDNLEIEKIFEKELKDIKIIDLIGKLVR